MCARHTEHDSAYLVNGVTAAASIVRRRGHRHGRSKKKKELVSKVPKQHENNHRFPYKPTKNNELCQ